jgi:hypothetical protein
VVTVEVGSKLALSLEAKLAPRAGVDHRHLRSLLGGSAPSVPGRNLVGRLVA